MSTCTVKEPTHYSKRVGREVPGVMFWLSFSLAIVAVLAVMFEKGLWCMRSRTQKQPQVKKELCRVLDIVK